MMALIYHHIQMLSSGFFRIFFARANNRLQTFTHHNCAWAPATLPPLYSVSIRFAAAVFLSACHAVLSRHSAKHGGGSLRRRRAVRVRDSVAHVSVRVGRLIAGLSGAASAAPRPAPRVRCAHLRGKLSPEPLCFRNDSSMFADDHLNYGGLRQTVTAKLRRPFSSRP